MTRVFPSQVLAVVDQTFSFAATQVDEGQAKVGLTTSNSSQLAAIVELVEQIPSHLILLNNAQYAEFTVALASIRNALEMWPTRGDTFILKNIRGFGTLSPVTLLRRALAGQTHVAQ